MPTNLTDVRQKIDAFDNKVKTAGMYANERKREYYQQCVNGA